MEYTGSCLCRAVSYKVVGEFESFYLCHCGYCRKDTGSAHAANLFSSTARLEWLTGESQVRVFELPNTQHVKAFCTSCGSALPSLQMEGGLLVVPAGSLDVELDKSPDGHIFISKKANWDEALESVPGFLRFPHEE